VASYLIYYLVKIISFSYQIIIIEGTGAALKHNRISVIILVRFQSNLLAIVIEDTQL